MGFLTSIRFKIMRASRQSKMDEFYLLCNVPCKVLDFNKRNLNLLGYRALKKLMNESIASDYSIKRNRFMGITMAFSVVCNR